MEDNGELCSCALEPAQRLVTKEGSSFPPLSLSLSLQQLTTFNRHAGPNKGKIFYVCPKPQAEQCEYFVWSTDRETRQARRQDPPVDDVPAPTGDCYICHQGPSLLLMCSFVVLMIWGAGQLDTTRINARRRVLKMHRVVRVLLGRNLDRVTSVIKVRPFLIDDSRGSSDELCTVEGHWSSACPQKTTQPARPGYGADASAHVGGDCYNCGKSQSLSSFSFLLRLASWSIADHA